MLLLGSFLCFSFLFIGQCHPHSRWVLPLQLTLFRNAHWLIDNSKSSGSTKKYEPSWLSIFMSFTLSPDTMPSNFPVFYYVNIQSKWGMVCVFNPTSQDYHKLKVNLWYVSQTLPFPWWRKGGRERGKKFLIATQRVDAILMLFLMERGRNGDSDWAIHPRSRNYK